MKGYFFAKNDVQDIIDLDRLICAWKIQNEDDVYGIEMRLAGQSNDSEFYFLYDSEHARDMDLSRLKETLASVSNKNKLTSLQS